MKLIEYLRIELYNINKTRVINEDAEFWNILYMLLLNNGIKHNDKVTEVAKEFIEDRIMEIHNYYPEK